MFQVNERGRMHVEMYSLRDNGVVPNSHLPTVYFRALCSFSSNDIKSVCRNIEELIRPNNWKLDWVDENAVHRYTHYHSTAHEMLIVLKGTSELRVGGSNGKEVRLNAGDGIVIPAGVAHRRISGRKDFTVAGIYPNGQKWDMMRQTRTDYKESKKNISSVSLPTADPFFGTDGPLMMWWS